MSPRHTRMLVAAIAVGVPAPALASDQRLGPPRTFASGNPFVPSSLSWTSVALNVRGDAVVGGVIARTGGSIPVVRQRARSRGSWGAPVRLAAGRSQTGAPVVAVNEGGAAIAVFASGGRLWSVRRAATGGWTRASSAVASLAPRHLERVALLGDGRARLVTAQANRACSFVASCTWTISVLQQPARGGVWTTVGSPIAVPAMNGVPRLAMSRTGHVLVAWSQSGQTWGARVLAGEPAVEPPTELAPVEGAWPAIGDGGDGAVAYGADDSPAIGRGFIRLRPAVEGWGPPEEIVSPTAATPSMRVAVDRDGSVTVAWTRFTAGGRTDGGALYRHIHGETWSSAGVLTTSSDIETLQIAQISVDAGRTMIIWDRHEGPGDNITQLTTRGPSGAWSTVSSLTYDGYPPSGFGTAAGGDALFVGDDMTVRNFDAFATAVAARAGSPRVRVRGRYATVSFSLNLRATVVAQRVGPLGTGSRTRLTDPRIMGSGTRRITLGPLPPGRYQVSLGACHAARGCTFSRPGVVAFRVR